MKSLARAGLGLLGLLSWGCGVEQAAPAARGERDAALSPVTTRDAGQVAQAPTPQGPAGEKPWPVDASLGPSDAGAQAASDASLPESPIAPRGAPDTFDVGSWNLAWFGSPTQDPKDDALQLAHARDVIAGAELDVWGLVEIVSSAQLEALTDELPGYASLLANDDTVALGSTYYAQDEQKPALLYRTDTVRLDSAKVILTSSESAFAGRPPLEARLTINVAGVSSELVMIVLHAKALDDVPAWEKRLAAAKALKIYLDSLGDAADVMVVGDFNDTILGSITQGKTSPYGSFVNDTDYAFVSRPLAEAKIGTTVGRNTAIDHHLTTRGLFERYLDGSVEAYRVDDVIADYKATTSDHYPLLSRYRATAP